MNTKDTEVLGR